MSDDICWVETIPDAEAAGAVKAMYDAVRHDGKVHNLYRAGALYPTPVPVADQLYKIIMHDDHAPLEMWLRELIGTHVAILAGCHYALVHHGANFRHLHEDETRAQAIIATLQTGERPETLCDPRVLAILDYNHKLSVDPNAVSEQDIEALRSAGVTDAEILHVNQVSASFAYWVRVINGLGINLKGEQIDEPSSSS